MTAAGSGYTTAPTVTASGGGCTTEPTFAATVSAGALASVAPTYLGVGCTSAPTLAIGGPGTGAAATAALLPTTVGIQAVVPTSSCNSIMPTPGGACLAWLFECWLTVPQYRVPFYGSRSPFALPGTSQSTSVVQGVNGESLPAGMVADLASGTLTAYASNVNVSNTATASTVEAMIQSSCSAAQTALNGWNPWSMYGTYFAGGVWTTLGVQ